MAHIELPDELSPDEAKLLLAIKLFELHRVSLGRAANLAGFSKAAFMEILGKFQVPVFDYPAGELKRELDL